MEDTELDYQCKHDRSELRKRIFPNGGVQYVKQCLVCGYAISNPIAKDKIQEIDNVKEFDNELKELWDGLQNKLYKERREKIQNEKEREKEIFDKWYSEYLLSQEWQAIRDKILKRDNYICQGCLKNEAILVHHLTYAHVGEELLFELISLCEECHKKCHKESNKKWLMSNIFTNYC